MKSILLVDDEVQILKSLSRAFFNTDYEILTASSGAEALEIIDYQEINVIISDMKMPLMDGYELLHLVKQRHPEIIRIILSGYSEEETIFKALLNNVAKVYLLKPWDNEKLVNSIDHLLNIEDQLKEKKLLSFIDNLELFTLKSNYTIILLMIENDNNISEICDEIGKEPVLCAKLLHIANSALNDFKTVSIRQAVNFIGLQNLKSLLLSMSVIDIENTASCEKHYVKNLWNHSFLTNKILNYIYKDFLKKHIPDVAISAGVLHNIGEIILFNNNEEKCSGNSLISSKEHENEKSSLGITHQELGGYLINWWGLPFQLVEVALYHHTPYENGIINTELVEMAFIAQFLAYKLLGDTTDDLVCQSISEKNNINFCKLFTTIENHFSADCLGDL